MGLPRSKYVLEGKEGVYHCFSRCVRRAFLHGFDAHTRRDFSHRKTWLVNRLRELAAIFAIDVCAYAVMENHYHTILRTRPDIVDKWSNEEVASRWLTLFPRRCGLKGEAVSPRREQIRSLANCPERIAVLRQRLSSLSWFMGRLNEFIARAANKEDGVKGRFWESRFKCQALLDDAAIAACMVYVDLNPIRAGRAGAPEESNFTSIQERIRIWQKERMTVTPVSESVNAKSESIDGAELTRYWLCPISSESNRRGILPMTAVEYFELVDKSGRMMRSDKGGTIDTELTPILLRIGAKAESWSETIARFGHKFCLVAGLLYNLRNFADQLGKRWFKGIAAARVAFSPSPPQLA
jgi:putative transposase